MKCLPVHVVFAVVEVAVAVVGIAAEDLDRRVSGEFHFPISVLPQTLPDDRSGHGTCRTRIGRCSSKRSSPNP